MVGFVASMLVWPMFVAAPERKPIAQADAAGGAAAADGQANAAETLDGAHPAAGGAADPAKTNSGGKANAGKSKPKNPAEHGKTDPASTVKGGAAPPVVLLPWQTENRTWRCPARPIEQIAFERFDRPADLPSLSDFKRWFTPIAGGQANNRLWTNRQLLNFDGALKFNAPWAEDHVLRLSLVEFPGLAMHFWKGKHGTTVRLYPQKWTIAAYATERDNDNFEPKRYAAFGDRRWAELECHGGQFSAADRPAIPCRRADDQPRRSGAAARALRGIADRNGVPRPFPVRRPGDGPGDERLAGRTRSAARGGGNRSGFSTPPS